jgi:two-component system, LytTR family, sensor kinase
MLLLVTFQKHDTNEVFVFIIILIVFYYLNTLVFIPRFLFRRRFVIYFTAVALCLLLAGSATIIYSNRTHSVFAEIHRIKVFNKIEVELLSETINKLPDSEQKKLLLRKVDDMAQDKRLPMPGRSVILLLFIFAVGLSITVIQEYLKNEKLREEAENERLNSELSFLKSQVNPHFLFNTLNSIYSLANKKSDKTANAIVKLSNILRYMIYDTNIKLVNLESEIQYLSDYIELQRLRLYDNTKISFIKEGDITLPQIAPMILIPFVENAFKHGIDTSSDCYINIFLKVEQSDLIFKVENSVPYKNGKDKVAGIGLQNVKRRLKLLYPENHLLLVDEHENYYCAKLNIRLTGYEASNNHEVNSDRLLKKNS